MKWAGLSVSYDDWIDFLETMCDARRGEGTWPWNTIRTTSTIGKYFGLFTVKVVNSPSIQRVYNHAMSGGAVIFAGTLLYEDDDLHASLIVKHKDDLVIVNGRADREKSTVLKLNRKIMRDRIFGHRKQRSESGLFLIRK